MESLTLTKEQTTEFESKGYFVVRNFFSPEEIAPLHQAMLNDPSINGALFGMVGDTKVPQPFCTWLECGEDIVGLMPRIKRTVDIVQALLGDECYHWHSKFVIKPPNCNSLVGWHQDYASWYDDGVMYPNMLTIAVAITRATKENGCTKVIPGTHKMGRIDHASQGASKSFEARLARAKKEEGIVHCELEPGDALIFHCNLLHAAGGNNVNEQRVVMFSSYNARSNSPISDAQGPNEEGAFMNITQQQRLYKPFQVVPNDSISASRYSSAFGDTKFISPKTDLGDKFVKVVKFGE